MTARRANTGPPWAWKALQKAPGRLRNGPWIEKNRFSGRGNALQIPRISLLRREFHERNHSKNFMAGAGAVALAFAGMGGAKPGERAATAAASAATDPAETCAAFGFFARRFQCASPGLLQGRGRRLQGLDGCEVQRRSPSSPIGRRIRNEISAEPLLGISFVGHDAELLSCGQYSENDQHGRQGARAVPG